MKWHGASKLLGVQQWRRIDLLVVPWDERGAALLYFTGNDIFNRSMRLLASKKGYGLNQRGLFRDVLRGPRREKLTNGTKAEGEDEKVSPHTVPLPRESKAKGCLCATADLRDSWGSV